MKVAISTMVLVAATLTQGLAIADPNAEAVRGRKSVGWCGSTGMACAKDKRDVATVDDTVEDTVNDIFARDADADAVRGRKSVGWCGSTGMACARVKRSADAIAEAFAHPEAVRGRKSVGWCGSTGMACAKAKRDLINVGEAVEEAVTDLYVREADAEAVRGRKSVGWCGSTGMACAKEKRDAVADPEAKGGFIGKKKPKKKGLDPWRRRHFGRWGWCGATGMACAKVKRDAIAEAEAIAVRGRKSVGWCGSTGMACAKEKREAEPTYEEIKRDVCEAEDGECTALRNALSAFQEIKRSDELLEAETLASIAEDDEVTKREAEACSAPGGDCDLAKRSLNEIEARLTAAVEAL